ncbi:MAG TPA: EAL domain-containing protein [Actinoplanes sp.]|nr:EAL domain-containing protein [Actinoplanes sp.]
MAAWTMLGGGLLAVAGFALAPAALRTPVFVLVATVSMAALLVGTRRHPVPADRRPWWRLLAAQLLFFGATMARLSVPAVTATPPGPAALLPLAFIVPGYLLLAGALVDMLRRRNAQDERARTDAVMFGLATGLAVWALLMAPALGGATPRVEQFVAAFFPVVDVLLLTVVARLMLTGGTGTPALWLQGGATGAMFIGDVFLTLGATRSGPQGWAFDALFLVAYVSTAASALHPSMRTLTEPQPVRARTLGKARIAAIAAALLAPATVALLYPPHTLWNGLVRLAFSIPVAIMIITRIVRSNDNHAKAEQAARWQATHDPLTELPNRQLLSETVARWSRSAVEQDQEISLLFLDLDRFKLVNDAWGHEVGDELLCAVGARLSAAVRAEDLVCRIGGDEFVIAMASPSHERLADSLAQRLVADFNRPFDLSVGEIIVTPSIGVGRATGPADALALIRDADTAMYQAKEAGRNGYAFFDASLRERTLERMEIDQSLRGALDRGELAVHYQPIVDLATEQSTGFEALMRWNSPKLGPVSPVRFIPVAEDTGLIVASGAWLLDEAAGQLARWTATQPAGTLPLHVSVNLSVRQLRDSSIVDLVGATLARTGLPPEALWLEITESAVMQEPESALGVLSAMRSLGVTLCIDDFGTGYSSLNYLKRLPVGIVKIDRSFVNGLGNDRDDEAIVRTVVAMSHALGRQVVAEGVETEVQRDWLQDLGCDLAQGWLYGRPQAADTWSAFPQDRRRPQGTGQSTAVTR